jgi:uncharacterized phage protein (TIGR02218 family)
MKAASDSLRAILASGQFHMADCYSFILAGSGSTIRYTTADAPITDQATGNVFAAFGPFFQRSNVKFQTGVQVDELSITLTAQPTDTMFPGGPTWLSGLRAGVLDGAEVQLDRAFMADFGDTSAGLVTLFYGRVVEVDVGRSSATIKANTHLELLNLQWPWRLFQPGCSRTLFDAGCTLAKGSFRVGATVTTGSSLQALHTDYAEADGYASLGTVTFTGGTLTGRSFAIKVQNGGVLDMLVPLPALPTAGDTLDIYPGCNKTQATCSGKFGNLQHFQGEPYVPVPEMAA